MRAIIYFLIFSINGCAYLPDMSQINTLKQLGDSQEEIEQYTEKKEYLFSALVNDIKNKNIKPGISKKKILSVYGEAVLTKKIDNSTFTSKVLLYRHPLDYFSSERVYLYFDEASQLSHWKYESPQQAR